MISDVATLGAFAAKLFETAPKPLPADWVQSTLILPDSETDQPGPWSLRQTPYDVDILNWWGSEAATDGAVVSVPQGGKSLIAMGGVSWNMVHDPGPAVFVYPNKELMQSFADSRWKKFIDANPVLAALKPADADAYKSKSQDMEGSMIDFVNAMSIANLSSRPKRIVVQDETDKYTRPKKEESHASLQADKRTQKQGRPKRFKISTPTLESGVIWQAFLDGDQREWHWPCPGCGKHFIPETKHIKWDPAAKLANNKWDFRVVQASAHLVTPCCGTVIREDERVRTSCQGMWMPMNTDGAVPGYFSWRRPLIIMPWRAAAFGNIATLFLRAKASMDLHDFANSVEARPFKQVVETTSAAVLQSRAEKYAKAIPDECLCLTASVDVQADRLEVSLYGWGVGLENWLIEYLIIDGSPGADQTWAELETWLLEPRDMPIVATAVDTGGHHTQKVYDFCKAREHRRIFAVKGHATAGRPIAPKGPSIVGRQKVKLFMVGTDTAKAMIHSHFAIERVGPGYCHFPDDLDREFYDQLFAEEQRTRKTRGYTVHEWHKVRDRNEALDLRVYAYAAVHIMGGVKYLERLDRRRRAENVRAEPIVPGQALPTGKPRPRPMRRGFGLDQF